MASPFQPAGLARAARPAPAAQRTALLIAGGFGLLHVAMYGYDLRHADRFLNADRADERLAAIRGFIDLVHGGGDLRAYLATHGIVGDWLPHALLYLAGGQYLVIAVQVLLVLTSLLCVRELGVRLGLGERRANAAMLLYGLLPHTLVLPHTLSPEGFSVPLVVIGFALALRGMDAASQARGGLALGLSILVRPVTMLWPFVHAALVPASARARATYLLVALAPLGVWMAFIYSATGQVSTGPSSHDLAYNLNLRVQRIVETMPPGQRPALDPRRRTMSVGEYLRFAWHHPRPTLAHDARDMMVLGLKSGIERVVLDYLELFPGQRKALQDSDAGWRAQVDTRGWGPALLALYRTSPVLVTLTAVSAALFALLVALAVLGAFGALRQTQPTELRRLRWVLVAFVLYVVATAQVVDAVQSRHRAPAEFALCLLAVAGWSLLARIKERRDTRGKAGGGR